MVQGPPEFVTQVSGGKLCEECQEMDIKSFFEGRSRPIRSQEETDFDSGSGSGSVSDSTEGGSYPRLLAGMIRKKECPLCRFVVEAIRFDYESENLPDSIWDDGKYKGKSVICNFESEELVQNYRYSKEIALDFWQMDKPVHPYQINVATVPDLRKADVPNENYTSIQILNYNSASHDAPSIGGQGCLVPAVLDSSRVRRWLETCERRHSYAAAGTRLYPELRVIDLERGCVVQAPQPCRYVTLSYLWGTTQFLTLRTDTFDFLYKDDSLSPSSEGLARAIQDTIILTKAIDERFLWVDALYIVQDNKADKDIQINVMDRMYEQSILTIVACHSIDANAGLPGVREGTRFPKQLTCILEGLNLNNCMLPIEMVSVRTRWITRGWTYQEGVIANRLLYVTTNQAYFECRKMCKS